MPLSTHTIRTEKVRLSATNDFEVRAITFPDLTFLVGGRMADLVAIVAKYQEGREEAKRGNPADIMGRKSMGELAIMVARDFPGLAVEIISGCVYGETVDDAMRQKIAALPMPVQLDAMVKISRLTVEEAGGLGNLIAELRQRLTEAMTGETVPQATGTPSA